MSIEQEVLDRAGSKCELCEGTDGVSTFQVPSSPSTDASANVLCCGTCLAQIEDPAAMDANHWRCLNSSMWSEVPAVQVLAWRQLKRLESESWAVELLEMLYLEGDVRAWAEAGVDAVAPDAPTTVVHKDSNGVQLAVGDTVTLIKDLVVKGGGFTAKRGTAVRGIALVEDNPAHIEGRVSGQLIVILTEFVKKAN